MSRIKSIFRIPVILFLIFVCLAPWFSCTQQEEPAVQSSPEITEPNKTEVVIPADVNTSAARDINMNEEQDELHEPDTKPPQPQPVPAEGPNQPVKEPNLPPQVSAPPDVNDKELSAIQKSPGDEFNKNFEPIFSEHVNEYGMVDYDKLHRYDRKMKALLARLATLEPKKYDSWTRNEKIAFWINTFNLKTLDIMADNYPIESKRFNRLWWPPNSIRHIPPREKVGTPKWDDYKFIVMDEQFTLSEIENRYFRKQFTDPRIFLALSLASLDSPPMQGKPYYGAQLDEQLDEQVKRFLSTSGGIKINRKMGKVELSAVFEPKRPWYGMEFQAKYGTDKKFKNQTPAMAAVLNFICEYIDQRDAVYLETGNYKLSFSAFDWRVNEQ